MPEKLSRDNYKGLWRKKFRLNHSPSPKKSEPDNASFPASETSHPQSKSLSSP
jgi:hypothetical protein